MKLIINIFIVMLLALTFSACGDSSLDNLEALPASSPEINTAPIANAGESRTKDLNDTVLLDGSGSYDEEGDELTYTWSITSPDGTVNSSSTTSSNLTFIADQVGIYTIKLSVNDGLLDSETEDTVSVNVTSVPVVPAIPIANAGLDENVTINNPLILDGSGSSPVDVEYAWSVPESGSSTFALENSSAVKPSFTPYLEGSYTIQLVVNVGAIYSEPSYVTITSKPEPVSVFVNIDPIVNAGMDQNVSRNTRVDMNASATDANGDALTYLWTIVEEPDSSDANISDSSALNPYFDANVSGEYVLTLSVSDGNVSVEDNVTVNVIMEDLSLKANAGSNQEVSTSDTVTLDASLSSVGEGATLTYAWQMTSKPENSFAKLSDESLVRPTFTVDVEGAYVFSLRVNDGVEDSNYAFVTINAADANVRPTANAGVNQNVKTSTAVGLDGSLSADANLDDLVYKWEMISKPEDSNAILSGNADVNPSFTTDVDGAYVFQLIVSDYEFESEADYVTVQAETNNSIPTAVISSKTDVITLFEVTLNGSSSSDPDKDHLIYIWHIISTPPESEASLSNPSVVNPFFTADKDGEYVIQLVVNDGITNSEAVKVTIAATTENGAPTAIAGSNQNVKTGSTVIVDASTSSDPNNDELTYSWIIASKPTASASSLSDSYIVNPVFTADVDGAYVLGVSVSDGTFESDRAYVTIVATTENSVPIAKVGADENVTLSNTFYLDASASSDADVLDTLTHVWSIVSTPIDVNGSYSSTAPLLYPTDLNTSFTPDVVGSYVFELIVNDGKVDSAADYLTIHAQE